LRKAFEQYNEISARVGVLSSAGSHGTMTLAEIAVVHEFGTSRIPQRSFLRSTLTEKRDDFIKFFSQLLKRVVEGGFGLDRVIGLVGQKMVAEVRKKISSGLGVPPPNAPSTIARKGSARTLVDTGRLVSSITYEIVKK